MKIALASDLHGQLKTLEFLDYIKTQENPDGIILSGDLSAGDPDFLDLLFAELSKYKNAFIICGNADYENRQIIDSSVFSINQKCKKLKGIKICGLSDYEEAPINSAYLGGSIFVTHRPPVRKLLESKYTNSPSFHISGHLHSAAYAKKYVALTHIQVPTLQDGRYATLESETGAVVFKSVA
jgi:predicted phosphodiesterase